ncbi:transposase [Nonomuraea sp. NPDC049152]|uniref:transposase n=1 Tax=Nonomuraea sp. NPDC049152 TaxID=3154350 RepID=UPI0034119221
METDFVDLSGVGGLLGQAAGRTGAAVIDWLAARGAEWTAVVRIVAIYPAVCSPFAVGRALPYATIVVDHFRLVALANTAVSASPTMDCGVPFTCPLGRRPVRT